MIVEDNNVTARSLQMSLEKLGYTVTAVVASGEIWIESPKDNGNGTHFCFTIPDVQAIDAN